MSMIELELSEDEKAALLVSLAKGLSESTVTHDTSSKSISFKKEKNAFKGPPRPENRDGMGRFIPKPGQEPLSQYDRPTPGPSDYVPDLTKVLKQHPGITMGEHVNQRKKKVKTPAPNKYDTRTSFAWGKCRNFTLKSRLSSTIAGNQTTPGPASYDPPPNKSQGPTFSIRRKPADEKMPGLSSALAFVPDRSVPGPSYRPSDDEWIQRPQTFGTAARAKKPTKKWPGPASYKPEVRKSGPKWKFGVPVKNNNNCGDGPGPATYSQKTHFPSGPRFTMGHKPKEVQGKHITPGPDQYNTHGFDLREPGFTLQYRWWDREPEKKPGPGQYNISRDPRSKSTPAFSFPNTWPKNKSNNMPGPGQYDIPLPSWNKGKTMSIGPRRGSYANISPGPADYKPEKNLTETKRKAPAYTLSGWNHKPRVEEESPGPASYSVRLKGNKPGKSMGLRTNTQGKTYGPGPAAPIFGTPGNKCERSRGATVKGRHTPIKYIGLGGAATLREPSRDVASAPLIG